jgi:hypothetical protein
LEKFCCLIWGNFLLFLIFCLKQIVLYNLHQLGEGKYGASTITWAVELYSVVVQGYILQAG